MRRMAGNNNSTFSFIQCKVYLNLLQCHILIYYNCIEICNTKVQYKYNYTDTNTSKNTNHTNAIQLRKQNCKNFRKSETRFVLKLKSNMRNFDLKAYYICKLYIL